MRGPRCPVGDSVVTGDGGTAFAGSGGSGMDVSFGSCFLCLDCDVDGSGEDSPSEADEAERESCFTVELPDD